MIGHNIVAHVVSVRIIGIVATEFKLIISHLHPVCRRNLHGTVTGVTEDVSNNPNILVNAGLVLIIRIHVVRTKH